MCVPFMSTTDANWGHFKLVENTEIVICLVQTLDTFNCEVRETVPESNNYCLFCLVALFYNATKELIRS
jgi:hypothetical protein